MKDLYATNANNSNGITHKVCDQIMKLQNKNPDLFIWSMNYGDEDEVKGVKSFKIIECDPTGITWSAGPFTHNQRTLYASIINIFTENVTKGGKKYKKSKKQTKSKKSKKSNKSKKNKNQRK